MPGARILVVDDEAQIRRALQVHLESMGYDVSVAEDAEQALEKFARKAPDVMVVDLLLPGMGGLELARRVREHSAVAIIVLSAIHDERKKVEALELGADDYVTKPFGMPELAARVKSVLRRSTPTRAVDATFTSGELTVNFDRREVRVGGAQVHLTPKEYDLLKYMIEHSGKVLTHRMMLAAVWGPSYVDQAQYLRVFVGQLRRKLEKDPAEPRFILTDPGVGYRFAGEPGGGPNLPSTD